MAEDKTRKRIVVEEVESNTSPSPEETTDKEQKNQIAQQPEIEPVEVQSEGLQELKTEATSELSTHQEDVKSPETVASTPPPQPIKENKVSLKVVIFLTAFIAIMLGALIGGVMVFISGVNQTDGVAVTPSPQANLPSFTPEPTPTPVPVDKKAYTINIQNGSGIAGEGARAAALLRQAEFTVGAVGNAATFNYTDTIIQAKATVSREFLSELETALEETYFVADRQELADSSSVDIIVIVGSEKRE